MPNLPSLASVVGKSKPGTIATGELPSLSSLVGNQKLPSLSDLLSKKPANAAPKKKSTGGFLGSLEHVAHVAKGVTENLGKDVGETALGVGPGVVTAGRALGSDFYADTVKTITSGGKSKAGTQFLHKVVESTVKQEKGYYGHDLVHHLYQHPLQPIVDALTLASGGLAGAAKAGKVAADAGVIGADSRLAKLGDRATVTTRSPRNIATGEGPVQTDITSHKPHIKIREQAAAASRAKHPEGRLGFGGELKKYGKTIQSHATQNALKRAAPYDLYHKVTKRLTKDEWTALHLRAIDIHPDDLTQLWKGKPAAEIASDPVIQKLVLHPTKRMVEAEPQLKMISKQGEAIFKKQGLLKDDTAAARPDLTKRQASDILGRPVKEVTGEPYYFPHTIEPERSANPLVPTGGGKAVPRLPGTTKQSTGALGLSGKLHLRSDVLGPEFLRRIKYVKYDEIHNALIRGAVRVTGSDINEHYAGKLPKGWEFVREKASTRIPATLKGAPDTHVPIDKLIPNPDDLHDSALAQDGFSTTDETAAHKVGEHYYIVPKQTVKAATGEFTRSSDFTHNFIKRPLSVWRAAVLGLRVGFLTNNLVGNSVMYGVKTGGRGALRDLFGAILESHGRETAMKALDSQATPPGVRADLYKEFFPEQIQGTFGRTQSPSTTPLHAAGRKTGETYRSVTGAVPRLTSKVAEEYPRRALIRHYVRTSPEFRKVYTALPRQTRSFETAARTILEGKGGAKFQRYVSKQVNDALGDYLHLSSVERNVLRNALPFYSWYKAISTTTYHLAVDTPLRANILGQIGYIGKEQSDAVLGKVPSFLEDSILLGRGKGGTKRVLTTQGLNPYSTIPQLIRGSTSDITSLGVNPFLEAGAEAYAGAKNGKISPTQLIATALSSMLRGLPPAQLIAPSPPSQLYPNRNRMSQLYAQLGVPIKEYNPSVAASQARQGR